MMARVVGGRFFAFFILLLGCVPFVRGQEFYHPELEWKTIETDHFLVHYHDGAERTGRVVAKIAEDVFEPITSLYNHTPDQKVSFIVKDYDDYSNGAAYFYDNKVEIWAPSMDFDFRGTHNWLRNVITHEFTHIVQIQTAMKFGRRMPGFYLQWLGYESERRPDVLYGFPNVIASYPISGFLVPAWFAEGVAQYNRPQLRYDFWDSHRDMILRSYVLNDSMLTWNQMAVFGKTSLGNESSYNAGFAFVHYIAQKYGIGKLNEISRNLSSLTAVTIDEAIEKATGKDGELVYNEWKEELKREYGRRVAAIRTDIREGSEIRFRENSDEVGKQKEREIALPATRFKHVMADEAHRDKCEAFLDMGFGNLYPAFSPDGKRFAFVSTGRGSYLSQSQLYVANLSDTTCKAIVPGVGKEMSWSPDGKRLYYGRIDNHNPNFSMQSDLYVYDVEKEEEMRLTYGRRAMSPSVSPDGKMVAFVVGADGTSNLAVMKTDTTGFRLLTSYKNGEQVYAPKWSPQGDRIVFSYSIRDGHDLAWIRPDGSEPEFLVTGDDDSRSPVFTPDGSRILFSSDRTGIFNIYSYDLAAKKIERLTNVLGGAFMPTMNADGTLVYANYTSKGYKLYVLPGTAPAAEGGHEYLPLTGEETALPQPVFTRFAGDATDTFDWQSLRAYDDTKLSASNARSYRNVFTSLAFVPFLRFDNYNTKNKALESIKAGVYVLSNDVLEKLSMFGGAAFNSKLERDLFLTFNYRGRLPLFYQLGLEPVASLEMYNITRKTDNVISLPASTIPVDVTYNLTEFDVALSQWTHIGEFEFRYAHSRYSSTIEAFINYETSPPTLVPGSSDLYLIANDLTLHWSFRHVVRSNTSEINPVGRTVRLSVNRSLNKFNGNGEYDIGPTGLVPVYKKVNFTRVELNWREYIPFFFNEHTLTVKLRGGSILEHTVDSFFDFYAGGLLGMKGYPFYSIGGNEMAIVGLEYRFPLVSNMDVRFLQFYFDKLYASVYGDFGNAWSSEKPKLNEFKGDAGVELRLESFSWYAYPTRIFLNASYGLNEFERNVRGTPVKYGKEWRFYFGVLFGFDFD
jgi:Tol biopolymer transport system component